LKNVRKKTRKYTTRSVRVFNYECCII